MTDARIVRSRAGLRTALLDLLQTDTWERITIRDITARAGVGYNTYFRHYPDKAALLEDLAAAEIEALCDMTVPLYDSTDSRPACLALCRFVDEHRTLWAALLNGGADERVKLEMQRHAEAAAATRQDQRQLPGNLGTILTVTAMVALLAWWLRQTEIYSVETVAGIMHRVIISPAERG